MENVYRFVGVIVCGLGGTLLCIAIAGFCAWLASCAWVAFSDKFRSICKAESLIFEYRKHRERFLNWLTKNGGDDDEID